MRVQDILPVAQERLITVSSDASVAKSAKLLCDTHKALVVVCNPEGIMVGIITKTDVVRQVAHSQLRLDTVTASAAMTRDVTSCHPGDLLHDVLATMKERGFVHIPVVDQQSRPSGVVNARDALQALLREVTNEEVFLRAYIMGVEYR